MRSIDGLRVALVVAVSAWMFGAAAQNALAKAAQGAPAFPFPMSYDAPKAAPKNYHVLFEDARVRFIEVTLAPGETEPMHGHPYPSVIAIDAYQPPQTRKTLDAEATQKNIGGGTARAPDASFFPYCRTIGPEAPYAATNTGDFPMHYYRIEFKRQDWPDMPYKWQEWYPWMTAPLKPATELDPKADLGPKFSDRFPFPLAYDSVKASPNNHYMRYHDGHVRFIEVVIRPGETELMHGHPYSSVFARDGVPLGAPQVPAPYNPDNPVTGPRGGGPGGPLLPGSPFNSPTGGIAYAPQGFEGPNCSTMNPEAPHKVYNPAAWPDHFYRLEYTRLDGDDVKTKWRTLYPQMAQ